MAKQTINLGTTANDGTGDDIRAGGEKINENFDEVYSFTGWQSRYSATPATLTGAVNNFIVLTGTPAENGGLTLLDSNSRITPITLNDVISFDFSVTVETPAGSNHYIEIGLFIPGGGFYRSTLKPLLKGSGIDQVVSVSFVLPVEATFLAEGADIIIIPSVTLTGKDFYINAVRIHKGK
jgi:hypothetical protein